MTIDQYITKMMMEGEWGSHSEIVAFSEIYSVKIHIFVPIASQEPITRVVTADENYTISILFSGHHYDCLIPKKTMTNQTGMQIIMLIKRIQKINRMQMLKN